MGKWVGRLVAWKKTSSLSRVVFLDWNLPGGRPLGERRRRRGGVARALEWLLEGAAPLKRHDLERIPPKSWKSKILNNFLAARYAFFKREASMKSEKREKEERKSKNENTRLRRWERENLTVLPYLFWYNY